MAARPRTLPAAIAPVLVGTAAAIELVGELPRFGALIAALVAVVLVVALASGGDEERPPLRPAQPDAPLSEQLDSLDRMVGQAAER